MTPRVPDYSLVVACLNEEEALPHLFPALGRLLALCRQRGLAAELIFVDDGSTDGTAAILAGWVGTEPAGRVVTHRANRGFGAALRTGIDAATGSVVISYDADATYPIEDVLVLYDALLAADAAAAGASPFSGGGDAGGASPFRRFLSRGVVTLYRLAVGRRAKGITVFTCAFRAYRRDSLRRARHESDDFLAAAEILCLLLLSGATVVEVPSKLSARRHGVSKMKVLRTALRHLALAARVRLRLGRFSGPAEGAAA